MQSLNHIFLMGHLGADPEIVTTKTGKPLCRFNVATNSYRKNETGQTEETATWHHVKVFGRTAELCQQYLKKGSGALIDGYVQNTTYKKKDGTSGHWTEVVAQQVTFMSARTSLLPSAGSSRSRSAEVLF